jgi:hypothetical protein
LTARELLNSPIEEIAKYFKRQHRTVIDSSLGLETRAVFDFRNRSFRFDHIIKKGEMVVLTENHYTIYTRGDDYTYMRLRVKFNTNHEVDLHIATCEYITGKIIDCKRFTA